MAIPQVGTVGLRIMVTVKDQDQVVLDLSTATNLRIYLRRPNGHLSAFPAVLVTDGRDGQISYTTVLGDLDVPGEWRIQARITTGTATDYATDVQPFRIAENIGP